MDAGIQKLRGLLTFGREKEDPAHALRSLLESIADQSPIQVMAALHANYIPSVVTVSNLHMRFKLLESATGEIERSLPVLEQQVGQSPLPLNHEVSQAALVADNFLKSIAAAYLGLVKAIETQKLDSLLGHLLQNAARRAMQYLLRRQMLAYRAYAIPSSSSWLHMHALYRSTRRLRLAQGSGDSQTVEQAYAVALLMAYGDPNKFRRDGMDALRQTLDQLAPLTLIVEAASISEDQTATPSRFFIQGDQGNAGCPLSKLPAGTPKANNFVIECRNLLTAIDRSLEAKTNDNNERIAAPEATLLALRTAFGGQMTRRFHRQRFKPKAELVFGLSNLIHYLEGQALARRQEDSHPPLPEVGTSEWAIVDESPDGFRLRYQKGEQQQCQAGDVVGLQPKGQSRVHICILRRIANNGPNRLEVGLQEIASTTQVITLPISRQKAIFVAKLPGHGGKPGLLLTPGSMPPGGQVVVDLPESGPTRFHAAFCLEGNAVMELHLLDPFS